MMPRKKEPQDGRKVQREKNGARQREVYQQPRRRVVTGSNCLLALIGTVMIFCMAVVIVLNFRQIYYYDLKLLDLKKKAGLDDWIIRRNYDTLIDYNLVTKHVSELRFPSFPMSESGLVHFAEVKRILVVIQYLCGASLVLFLLGFLRKLYRRDYGCLKLMSMLTLVIPFALGTAAVLDWQQFFVRFHELLFSNDYWIFDPVTDPVIKILPDEFFFHCAVAVLVFIVLGSILSGMLYRFFTRKQRRRYR